MDAAYRLARVLGLTEFADMLALYLPERERP